MASLTLILSSLRGLKRPFHSSDEEAFAAFSQMPVFPRLSRGLCDMQKSLTAYSLPVMDRPVILYASPALAFMVLVLTVIFPNIHVLKS